MLLAEQQSRINHVFQCVFMGGYSRQTQRERDYISLLKRCVMWLSSAAHQVGFSSVRAETT